MENEGVPSVQKSKKTNSVELSLSDKAASNENAIKDIASAVVSPDTKPRADIARKGNLTPISKPSSQDSHYVAIDVDKTNSPVMKKLLPIDHGNSSPQPSLGSKTGGRRLSSQRMNYIRGGTKSRHDHSQVSLSKSDNNLDIIKNDTRMKWIMEKYRVMRTKYFENVTYKQESLLLAFALALAYMLVGVGIIYFDRLEMPSEAVSVIVEGLYILIGLLTVELTSILNSRHSALVCIISLIRGEATPKQLFSSSRNENTNKVLTAFALFFYACLIITELSISHLPVETFSGIGLSSLIRFDLDEGNPDEPMNILLAAIGLQYGCDNCEALIDGKNYIVPISETLRDSDKLDVEISHHSIQDVAIINVNCMTTLPSYELSFTDFNINMIVHSVSKGVSAASLDVEFQSIKDDNTPRVRRCTVASVDRVADAQVTYYVSNENHATRTRVKNVSPTDPSTCSYIGSYCLNDPMRQNLGYAMLTSVFVVGNYTLSQDHSLLSGMFPDPSLEVDDTTYASLLSKVIAGTMLVAAAHKTDQFAPCKLYTDTVAIALNVPTWLKYTTLVVSIICVLIEVLAISSDLLKLENSNDKLLRHLQNRVQPGKLQMEGLTKLLQEAYEDKDDKWDAKLIRFGEDKTTRSEPVGKLMFGKKAHIIKFKELRQYSNGFI